MPGKITLALAGAVTVGTSLLTATPAVAHGYTTSPPSRSYRCAQHQVADCGSIQYEPQSVEGPKGLRKCSGGNARFAVLDNDKKGWVPTKVGKTVTFTWTFTARHRTKSYEYYVGSTRIAFFDGKNQPPPAVVTHKVSMGTRKGKVKVLAIWNIADTVNAFYSCIDLMVS
jgi:predicted carbohydrate-binding protein with CBM5 and CBM33 domain